MDVKSAIVYCSGEDSYYKILQGYCDEGKRLEEQLVHLYEIQDWKNYTIVVHGIKSAMRSIGAVDLSEMAKNLEMAGKNSDIDYILKNHDAMMKVYKEFFSWLENSGIFTNSSKAEMTGEKTMAVKETAQNEKTARSDESVGSIESKEDARSDEGVVNTGSKEGVGSEENAGNGRTAGQAELWELDDEDFDSILEKLEESIYELNSRHMLEITEELKNCSYRQQPLREIVARAQRKIEMSDYLSAVDMIAEWKEKNRR